MNPDGGRNEALSRPAPRLALTLGLALLIHIAFMLGVQWRNSPESRPPAMDGQGVSIDLAPRRVQTGKAAAPPEPVRPPAAEEAGLPIRQPAPLPQPAPRPQTGPVPAAPGKRDAGMALPAAPQAAAQVPSVPPAETAEGGTAGAAASGPVPLETHLNPRPVYPELARRRGQEGLVRLRAHVDASGALTKLAVEESSGYPLLDKAALKAVKKWSFTPGGLNGKPTPGSVVVPVEFRLR